MTRTSHGFTLLEVMLAFAILAVIMTFSIEIIHENMEIAADAIDQREFREIADTVFGKILFEQAEHRDNQEGSIAVTYGQWAGLPQDRADRYEKYRWRLRKEELVAAGTSDEEGDESSLFEENTDEEETSTETEEETAKGSVNLVKFVFTVYHAEDPGTELIKLSRLLPPPDFGEDDR